MSDYGKVTVTMDGHVAIVEIDHPPHNHVNVDLMRDLADTFERLDKDVNVRVSLLCSAGKNFCAGADFAKPESTGVNGDVPVSPLYVEAVRLFSIKKPVVAAIQGAAVGAGLGLSLIADFRVVSPDARFAANFVKLGFHPGFGITHTLKAVIGEQRARLMCLTGRRIKGHQAYEWGLADELVEHFELRGKALELAREIAENAPLAVQSTRATFRKDLGAAVKAQTDHEFVEQAWLRKTNDFAEGVLAVRERRPGAFTGT